MEQAQAVRQAISRLIQKGLPDSAIIAQLGRQGFSAPQIAEAFGSAAALRADPNNMAEEKPEAEYGEGAYAPALTAEAIQPLVEAIVEEKWEELGKTVAKVAEWKESAEGRLATIETRLKELKENFDRLHASILERIGEYDKTMTDVGVELKALEKVFQKVLPSFVENVAELGRVTAALKELLAKPAKK